jgi:hypothetical protein
MTEPSGFIKHDSGKLRYDLIDVGALALLAGRLTFGAIKYPPNNWRLSFENGDWRERYYSAALRHLEAWRAGEVLDEEGLPHISGALVNVMFLAALSFPTTIADVQNSVRQAAERLKP